MSRCYGVVLWIGSNKARKHGGLATLELHYQRLAGGLGCRNLCFILSSCDDSGEYRAFLYHRGEL